MGTHVAPWELGLLHRKENKYFDLRNIGRKKEDGEKKYMGLIERFSYFLGRF